LPFIRPFPSKNVITRMKVHHLKWVGHEERWMTGEEQKLFSNIIQKKRDPQGA
jgi:hypothetical protein